MINLATAGNRRRYVWIRQRRIVTVAKLQATVSDHSDKPPSPSTLSVGIFEHLRLPSLRHGVFSTGSLFVTVGPQVVNSEGQKIRITYEVLK
ncbi:hypothetical protein RJT34_16240 [Clitoria ternatea]|uniref:Uncharacterized protein n=1 Tax=Clitoria ternatea TaxID=43366 RepID=A0AAN9P416_CLITE